MVSTVHFNQITCLYDVLTKEKSKKEKTTKMSTTLVEPAFARPSYVKTNYLNSASVEATSVHVPSLYLKGNPGTNGVVLDSSSILSLSNRVKQLEYVSTQVTVMENKLTSLITSVEDILVYLNKLKVAVELYDVNGQPINPPPE